MADPSEDLEIVDGPDLRARAEAVRDFLRETWPGRLLALGLIIKLFALAVRPFGFAANPLVVAVGTIGSLSLGVGLAYLVYQLVLVAKRRLLWRVRRKLILSYIFIGFVPALLIVAFFLLSGFLLLFNISAYLVRASLTELISQATFVARMTALEVGAAGTGGDIAGILERRQDTAKQRYPGVSLVVISTGSEPCAGPAADRLPGGSVRPKSGAALAPLAVAGPWQHVRPPAQLPSWVSCGGFGGLLVYRAAGPGRSLNGQAGETRLFIRGVVLEDAPRPAYAVVVDIPVTDTITERLREDTSIEVGRISAVAMEEHTAAPPAGSESGFASSVAQQAGSNRKYRFPWVTLLEYVDWSNGQTVPFTMQIAVNISDLYDRLSSAQARFGTRSFADLLMYVLLLVAVLFLIIEVGALIMGLALARSITGSVHELFAGTVRVRHGDFTHRIAVRARDQLGELADSFNSMTASIEDLLRQAAEKKRLEEEMRLAREIQMSLLPQGPLSVPGLDVAAVCLPAREVGGDYYDLMPLEDGRLALLIADVSGKGMSAALYMAELKGLILSLSRMHRSPRELLVQANRIIKDHLDSRSFITMTYAVVDIEAHTLAYARAGHTPLIYLPAGDGGAPHAQVLAPDGLVLGLRIDGGEKFEALLHEETLRLTPGDVLVFFTDGISEAMNRNSDCFGEPRLAALVEQHGTLPFDQLRERILREIEAFVDGAPQHDDMTMILVRVEPTGATAPQPAPGRTFAEAASQHV